VAETITRQKTREESSSDLKLRFRGLGTGSSEIHITVVEFSDLFSEAMAPLASYLAPSASVDFRRVVQFNADTGQIELNRASVANGAVDLYLILTPVDWNECTDRALATVYYVDRAEVVYVAGQSLYSLAAETWLQKEQQIENVLFNWLSSGWTSEKDAPSYDIIEEANGLSILFGALPESTTGLKMIVEARRFYAALALDSDATKCPGALIKAATKVEALRRVWSIMGEKDAKAMFEREMRQSEDELLDQKKRFVQQIRPHPLHADRQQAGPELPMAHYRW